MVEVVKIQNMLCTVDPKSWEDFPLVMSKLRPRDNKDFQKDRTLPYTSKNCKVAGMQNLINQKFQNLLY